jgi:drug/metabolite transporter (DMT)-like permease
VWLGLCCALLSAVCYGTAAALQAVAARAARDDRRGVDPRLLIRMLRQWRFVGSLGLDWAGFAAQAVALRILPLFVVQSAQAASIAVTAVCAARWFRLTLSRTEWASVAAVCAGLALLGSSAHSQGAGHATPAFHYGLLVAVVVLVAGGVLAGRLSDQARTVALGLAAGLLFGVLGMTVRVLPDLEVGTLLRDPATYALVVAGITGGWLYATAMQRGSIVTATAVTLLGETVPPAVIGLLLLGDQTRPGWLPAAGVGFAVALTGALMLARFGEIGEIGEIAPVALGAEGVD